MTDADYLRHIKFLGKLCYGFDNSAASISALTTLQATTMDQVADAALSSLPEVRLLCDYMGIWTSKLSSADGIRQMMLDIATALLTSADFIASLATAPATNTIQAVLDAWKADFTLNSKTLTTAGSTGLIHFLGQLGSVSAWPSASPGTHPDATYVVSAVV